MEKKKVRALKEVLEFAKEKFEDVEDRKPYKTVKMSKEAIKLHDEAEEIKSELKKLKAKFETVSEEMWGKIRRELDYPVCDLRINDEDMTIELYEPGED